MSAKQNLEIIKISNALSQGKSVSVGLVASVLEVKLMSESFSLMRAVS
ncbi:hypothetical protein JT236_05555 [Helicobacter pylori]|nr:hypothetical protein [Helicobacter pylori]WRA09748.1 hypothetical protein KVK09_04785 [Helicobacter pylori]WRG76487.1 hypothetical protein E5E10_04670 [Helicobacter pylori]